MMADAEITASELCIAAREAFRPSRGYAFALSDAVTPDGWPRDEVAAIRTDSMPDWRDNVDVALFAGEEHAT